MTRPTNCFLPQWFSLHLFRLLYKSSSDTLVPLDGVMCVSPDGATNCVTTSGPDVIQTDAGPSNQTGSTSTSVKLIIIYKYNYIVILVFPTHNNPKYKVTIKCEEVGLKFEFIWGDLTWIDSWRSYKFTQ